MRFKRLLRIFGPGLVTGASDDDPSGIATYAQAGAQFGSGLLWTMLLTWPLMSAVQEMCARVAIATGKGLSYNLRRRFPLLAVVAAILLLIANTVNIASDLLMMAASAKIVLPLPLPLLLLAFSCITICLEVFLPYKTYAKYLKWLSVALLAYPAVTFLIRVDWSGTFVSTVIPSFQWNNAWLFMLVAILGTTISPYLFYWQSSQEVEESRLHKRSIEDMRVDTTFGMFISNLVGWFVIIAASATFFASGMPLDTPERMARLLVPLAGPGAAWLFSLGMVGIGLLALPVLAGSAAFGIAELDGWREGLEKKWFKARAFYGVMAGATLAGLAFAFVGFKPLDLLLIAALLNGLCVAPVHIMILLMANDRSLLGKWKNGWLSNTLNILALLLVSVSALAFLATQV